MSFGSEFPLKSVFKGIDNFFGLRRGRGAKESFIQDDSVAVHDYRQSQKFRGVI